LDHPNSCGKEFFPKPAPNIWGYSYNILKEQPGAENSSVKVEVRGKPLEKEQMIAVLKSTKGKTCEFGCKYEPTV